MRFEDAEPVLRAVYRLLEEQDSISPNAVCAATGKPPEDKPTERALAYLYREKFIDGLKLANVDHPIQIEAASRGLEYASGWPRGGGGDQIEALLRVLDEHIASDETPEEEKGRLRRFRDGVVGVTRDIGVRVMSDYLARQAGHI